ncbi:MAG: hypothetical protein AAGA36_00205 [Pseudomonadota bacterium]
MPIQRAASADVSGDGKKVQIACDLILKKDDYAAFDPDEMDLDGPPQIRSCDVLLRRHPQDLIHEDYFTLIKIWQHCRDRDNAIRSWPDGKPLLQQPFRLLEAFSLISQAWPSSAQLERQLLNAKS